MSFKENFVRLCNENGVSPSKVVESVGLKRSAYSQWTDETVPRRATLMRISDYFGVTVDFLLRETDKKEKAPQKRGVKIPVFGSVAAGIPIEAIEDIEDYEEIPEKMASDGEYFGLKIKGNSMEPRICEGDVIIVRRQPTVESGEVAVVLVNGCDATCKKVEIRQNGISLISYNPDYSPMNFSAQQVLDLPVQIVGKVVELRGKF